MKKILFALGLLFVSNAFAATGTGEAQAELAKPLSVTEARTINFGSISIDPGAGAQTVELAPNSIITCPSTYVCSGGGLSGTIQINGAISTQVSISIAGSTATLSDGLGTLIFDPSLQGLPAGEFSVLLNLSGKTAFSVGGTIDFTGNEPAGTYNTTNAGGSGYQITVNY